MRRSHKADFEKMVDAQRLKVYHKLSDIMPNTNKELVKGQMVNVINGYGCIIGSFEILGFCNTNESGRCVFLDWDCYWFANRPINIIEK